MQHVGGGGAEGDGSGGAAGAPLNGNAPWCTSHRMAGALWTARRNPMHLKTHPLAHSRTHPPPPRSSPARGQPKDASRVSDSSCTCLQLLSLWVGGGGGGGVGAQVESTCCGVNSRFLRTQCQLFCCVYWMFPCKVASK